LGELSSEFVVIVLEVAVVQGFEVPEEIGKEALFYPVVCLGCLMEVA
jgi:hypothetical protein